MVKGDTESFGFELEGVENLDAAYFSCKRNSQDENYLFQKSLNSGITQRAEKQYVVRIDPDDTALLEPGQYWYDLEIIKNDDVFTIFRGVLEILPEITTPTGDININISWGRITGNINNQTDLQLEFQTKADVSSLSAVATSGAYSDLTGTPNFATVATSGSYADLSNKPSIPTNTSIIDLIYPVGSYYWNSNSTSPATLFGVGTWTQITNQFIFAAGGDYASGDTGGEVDHLLTIQEMPSHDHRCIMDQSFYAYGGPMESNEGPASGHGYAYPFYFSFTGTKGGSRSHNNMPPYIVAYCWRRDA